VVVEAAPVVPREDIAVEFQFGLRMTALITWSRRPGRRDEAGRMLADGAVRDHPGDCGSVPCSAAAKKRRIGYDVPELAVRSHGVEPGNGFQMPGVVALCGHEPQEIALSLRQSGSSPLKT
jgi:hypothetical protein